MKKRFMISIGIVVLLLLLIWKLLGDIFTYKDYQVGFPEEDSPALDKMMRHYLLEKPKVLIEEEEYSIIPLGEVNEENKELHYGQINTEKLRNYYGRMRNTDQASYTQMNDLMESADLLYEQLDSPLDYHLPELSLEGSILELLTNHGEHQYPLQDLLEGQSIEWEGDFSILVNSVTEDLVYLQIFSPEEGNHDLLHMFFKQDFSAEHLLVHDDFEDFLLSDQYDTYKPLFKDFDEGIRFVDVQSDTILMDSEKREIIRGGYYDLLSEEGKYVFLYGASSSFDSGRHRIQRTTDYLEQADKDYAKFHLSFRNVKRKLDWPSFGSLSGKIVYFAEDMLVLNVEYESWFSNEIHKTNVIIDLQGNQGKPSFYIVNLGIFL